MIITQISFELLSVLLTVLTQQCTSQNLSPREMITVAHQALQSDTKYFHLDWSGQTMAKPELKLFGQKNVDKPILLFTAQAAQGDRKLLDLYKRGREENNFELYWTPQSSVTTYRSPLLDVWQSLQLDNVSYSMYNNGVKQCELVFRVDSSDFENWMERDRLVYSYPWNLQTIKQVDYNIFRISGDFQTMWERSFAALKYLGNGCSGDSALMSVYEKVPEYCSYVKGPTGPEFLWAYDSNTQSVGNMESKSQSADRMVIQGHSSLQRNEQVLSKLYEHKIIKSSKPVLLFTAKSGQEMRKLFDLWTYSDFSLQSMDMIHHWTTDSNINVYRSPLLDVWQNLGLLNVTYSMYKDGVKQCELVFRADSSTHMDWMSRDRLIYSSPWNLNAIKQQGFTKFGIEGVKFYVYDKHVERRFYTMVNGNCPGDSGLMAVFVFSPESCDYVQGEAPVFMWAYNPTTKSVGKFSTEEAHFADTMVIEGHMSQDFTYYG